MIKNTKNGFTLVELVVVIAILAILVAIAIPIISDTIKSSKVSGALADAETLELSLKEAYGLIITEEPFVYPEGFSLLFAKVVEQKAINVKSTLQIGDTKYWLLWDIDAEKAYYVHSDDGTNYYKITDLKDTEVYVPNNYKEFGKSSDPAEFLLTCIKNNNSGSLTTHDTNNNPYVYEMFPTL